MARYQLIVAYDGTDFYGFQRQGAVRTVQLSLEKALKQIGWKGSSILCAGRTDRGVHASGQCIAFDMDWRHSIENLRNALNANLEKDLSVLEIMSTDEEFHPRFDAKSRTYQYRIYCETVRNPIRDRYAWRIYPELKLEILEQCAACFVGEFDFRAFGSPMKPGGSTIRNVMSTRWQQNGDTYEFQITANAFLYHMVRRIVYVQTQVSAGKETLEDVITALQGENRLKGGLAAPNGLFLSKVSY